MENQKQVEGNFYTTSNDKVAFYWPHMVSLLPTMKNFQKVQMAESLFG